MSALGQKRTFRPVSGMPAIPSLAAEHARSAKSAECQLRRSLDEIAGHENHGVIAGVAMPMHGLDAFRGRITLVECFRRAIFVGHRIGALQEINGGRPVLVIVNTDMATRRDVQHAQPQLPSGHGGNFGTEIDRYRFRGGVADIALRGIFGAGGGLPPEHDRENQ